VLPLLPRFPILLVTLISSSIRMISRSAQQLPSMRPVYPARAGRPSSSVPANAVAGFIPARAGEAARLPPMKDSPVALDRPYSADSADAAGAAAAMLETASIGDLTPEKEPASGACWMALCGL